MVLVGRPWTITHAHFLQMGGFKLCTAERQDNRWPYFLHYDYPSAINGHNVWEGVLVYEDFKSLLSEGKIDFPEISVDEINDQGKADALSKGVALLQITWFIVQLIARANQHLAITQLELTTAALAGVNSIMYLCWWNKPLDVRCPVIIRTKALDRLLVEKMEMVGINTGGGEDNSEDRWTFSEEEFQLRTYVRSVGIEFAEQIRELTSHVLLDLVTWLHWRQLVLGINVIIFPFRFLISRSKEPNDPSLIRQAISWIWTSFKSMLSKLIYLPYLLMFLPVDRILGPPWGTLLFGFSDGKDKMNCTPILQMLLNSDDRDMNWMMSMIFYSEKADMKPLLYFAALAGAAFGSIHCAAWHFEFPSYIEQVFWKAAALTCVGVCLIVIVAGIPLYNAVQKRRSHAFRMAELKPRNHQRKVLRNDGKVIFWRKIIKTFQRTPAIMYPLARLSLLFLAIISLRRLPESALMTVVWTKFIPHI